jgi:oxygen-independent coproporphyrinogen-3 oxidase
LQTVLDFRPEHLSCYLLSVEEGTPLARRQAKGQFQPLSEARQREFFLFTSRFLEDRGYLHYEISNFARGQEHRSRHNYKYWNHTPYLGLGPAAHSYVDGRRWWNHRSLQAYCQALGAGRAPAAGWEDLTPEQQLLEAIFLGLRTKAGINLNLMYDIELQKGVLQELLKAGLVEIKENRLIPTRQGFVVADRLPLWLVA